MKKIEMLAFDQNHFLTLLVIWSSSMFLIKAQVQDGDSLNFNKRVVNMDIDTRSLDTSTENQEQCTFTLVESIPDKLFCNTQGPKLLSTYEAQKRILQKAQSSVHLSTFYWTLLGNDTDISDATSNEGEDLFNILNNLDTSAVEVQIAENNSSDFDNTDTDILKRRGAQVRTLDFKQLEDGGVLHTKMWLVDGRHMYLGSANLDWRSYTQTKELGVLVEDCPTLGQDAEKLFQVYWRLGQPGGTKTKPGNWSKELHTDINMNHTKQVHYNNSQAQVYMASSPPDFCPQGRTNDIDALVDVINSAQDFIYISVMDYMPAIIYQWPQKFWPKIDNALRRAVIERRVNLHLMAAHWDHTKRDMYGYLQSLADLDMNHRGNRGRVIVKLFTVPADAEQEKIPFARVDHCKYMVTDQHAYIGTSNWSGDYFTKTGGLSFVLRQPKPKNQSLPNPNKADLRQQLEDVFIRDFNSSCSRPIKDFPLLGSMDPNNASDRVYQSHASVLIAIIMFYCIFS